ncbi:adenylate/guanylate cyclase domain-containing protein [Calditrichota bacterium]
MQRKSKIIYREWFYIIFSWLILMYLYFFVAFWGPSNFLQPGVIKDYLYTWQAHFEIILQSFVFGSLFATINTVVARTWLRKKSFGYIILVKSLLYIFAIVFAGFIVFAAFEIFNLLPEKNIEIMWTILSAQYLISLAVYLVFSILLINFLLQVDRKFGPGNLIKMLFGEYHKPKEEKRIFLFLDLKSSTTIAEHLGHQSYSRFLQNCFHDITEIVIKYKAEVYQYVGDEVVLTWKINDGLESLNCIKAFFAFENKLNTKKEFYEKQFNTFPEFKGGMDMGLVTVAEIGDLKRDIAYHGDVLNTASRIQHQCNKLNKKLLISKNVESQIKSLNGFSKEFIGELQLRGKEHTTQVFSLEYLN